MVSVSLTPRCVRDCFFYKFYELFSLNSTFINYHQVHSCPWQESRNEVVDDHAVALFLNLDWSHQFRHFRNFDDHQLDRHIRAMLWVPENVLLRSFSISLQMHSCLQTEGDWAALIIIVIWECPPHKKKEREKKYINKKKFQIGANIEPAHFKKGLPLLRRNSRDSWYVKRNRKFWILEY